MTTEFDGVTFDPTTITASNLVRVGAPEYEAVIGWVEAERSARAERAAANEETARTTAEALLVGSDRIHRQQAEWAAKNA
jgi:hypothetical protein